MTDDKRKIKITVKKPIPTDVGAVAYVTTSGVVRYCKTGPGIALPSDFKEWLNHSGRSH